MLRARCAPVSTALTSSSSASTTSRVAAAAAVPLRRSPIVARAAAADVELSPGSPPADLIIVTGDAPSASASGAKVLEKKRSRRFKELKAKVREKCGEKLRTRIPLALLLLLSGLRWPQSNPVGGTHWTRQRPRAGENELRSPTGRNRNDKRNPTNEPPPLVFRLSLTSSSSTSSFSLSLSLSLSLSSSLQQVPTKEVSLDADAAVTAVLATSSAKFTETVEFHAR